MFVEFLIIRQVGMIIVLVVVVFVVVVIVVVVGSSNRIKVGLWSCKTVRIVRISKLITPTEIGCALHTFYHFEVLMPNLVHSSTGPYWLANLLQSSMFAYSGVQL
jgi:hypothetical protein